MDRYYASSLEPIPENITKLTNWAREETPENSVFLGDDVLSMWIAALSGRRVFLIDSRAPKDYYERLDLENRIFAELSPQVFREAHSRYQITHIVLDPDTLAEYGRDLTEVDTLPGLELVYDVDEWKVYSIEPLIR
jgi:hypothetical protein